MSEQIILFDLASKDDNHCWSLNPWKTRLYLNWKGLDYKTEFVEYPDIKSRLEKHVSPNEQSGLYTIPTVMLQDGTYVMDSAKIVVELERLHPTPSIHLDSPYTSKVEALVPEIIRTMGPKVAWLCSTEILTPASVPYWNKARSEGAGMPVEQLYKEHGGDEVYTNAAPYFEQAAQMLKENADGPFFHGQEVSYADFIWAGVLRFLQRFGEDVLQKAIASNKEPHLALLQACQPWLKRDNY